MVVHRMHLVAVEQCYCGKVLWSHLKKKQEQHLVASLEMFGSFSILRALKRLCHPNVML